MAVLTESFSVVIKKSSLNQFFAGGLNSFKEYVSVQQSCFDDKLYSVHFTDVDELELFIDEMIIRTNDQLTVNDFALVDMIEGVLTYCNWLRFIRGPLFTHMDQFENKSKIFSIAYFPDSYLINEDINHIIRFPSNWTPDNALLGSQFLTDDRRENDLYFLPGDNGESIAFLKETNEQVFI